MRRALPTVALTACVVLCACGGGGGGGGGDNGGDGGASGLTLENYDGGFFALKKPAGWEVKTAGDCTTFAFLARDPQHPLREIFYFGTVGPVYTDSTKKQTDWNLTGGKTTVIPWVDAPVISPLTPANFVGAWPAIAQMWSATNFLPEFPIRDDLQIISSAPQPTMLAGIPGALTGLVRVVYRDGTAVGQGQFLVTTTPTPFPGLAYGNLVLGVSAPSDEFEGLQAKMVESLDSFTVTQGYVDRCLRQQLSTWGAIAEAGRTLSEAADIVYEGWVRRTRAEDVAFYRWNDTFRDHDRLYNPDTGTVYLTEEGWYDANRDSFQMKNLQDLRAAPLTAEQLYELYNKAHQPQSAIR